MSKVILTQEQADAIEYGKHHHSRRKLIDAYTRKKGAFVDELDVLYELDYDDFFKALYIGYEVKPEFKVGDWVVRTKELDHQNFHEGKIFKINSVIKSELMKELMVVDADDNSEHLFNNIRHATPEEIAEEKERRLFVKHGRGVWELRKNDILYNPWLGIRTVFHIRENGKVSFAEGHKEYEIDEIKESYRVACFAENRLDVKDDE